MNQGLKKNHVSSQLTEIKKQIVIAAPWIGLLSTVFFGGCASPDPVTLTEALPIQPAAVSLSNKDMSASTYTGRADEECCTDPGSVAACWWLDAERDRAVCLSDDDCYGSNTCNKDIRVGTNGKMPPNGWGLCGCNDDTDCRADGRGGVCTEINGDKVCGPSFCNGYLVCACWGGCTEGKSGDYETPGEMCSDTSGGFPGECCQGNYPEDPAGSGIGFCSDSCDGTYGGSDCNTDDDCVDAVLDPYSSDCTRQVCDDGKCRIEFVHEDDECANNVQVEDPGFWGTAVRDEALGILSCFEGRCSTAGRCVSHAAAADGLACNDNDDNTCTDEVCQDGFCMHDFSDHPEGELCNSDDNACTLDECDETGACTLGPNMDCDDANYCTYQDACEDNDPDHIAAECSNPPVDGNAADFGYVDGEECEDLLCLGGVEWPDAVDCSAINPDGVDLLCNTYSCVDGSGEDNCTLSYSAHIDDGCSDGDACTVGDRCVDAGGFGECQPTGDLDCDDMNECTIDSCSAGDCINTPDVGASCEDGNLCTVGDACDATGSCVPGGPPDCSSLDGKCANGVCDEGTGDCVVDYLAEGTSCDADGDPCTQNDACDSAGNCVTGTLKDCSSENDQCNTGVCNSGNGLCVKDPSPKEGDTCNADDDACTPTDTCQSGDCKPDVNPVSCASYNDQCNVSRCNSITGICEYDNAALVGAGCNLDNNGCTAETCDGEVTGDEALICSAETVFTCDDGKPCTGDTCTSTGNDSHTCANPNLAGGTACNADSNGCTANDQCNGAGTCTAGGPVDAADCETELVAAQPAFDTDCNTGVCTSTGNNTHVCEPSAQATGLGGCNADNDACTLDECGAFDPISGAVCEIGDARDCSGLDNLPCQTGVCDDSGDFYNSSCEPGFALLGTSCNADSDGCTTGDACNSTGACVAGAAPDCIPSDTCHTSTCASTGDDSYICNETNIAGCCETADDCIGQGYPCEGGGTCNGLVCNVGVCQCNTMNEGDVCDGPAASTYPENCYEGICNASGDCAPNEAALSDVPNNLCSDLFDPGDSAQFLADNVANLGDLGAGAVDGAVLNATGSTLCGYNNYRASALNNCIEKTTGVDLGAAGNDVVYSFRYWTPTTADHDLFSYVVKVEADFDAAVYLQDGIQDADDCPEGNNPDLDDSTNSVTRGMGYISYEIWTGYSGTSLAGLPPTTAANYTGFYSELQAPENWGNNYVRRVRGYLIAPTTGTYTFWIASDAISVLYLSPNDVPTDKVQIASVSGSTNSRQWDKYPAVQKSAGINLVAGAKYYIEALHKEGTGNDNLAVGWARPGESTAAPSEVIPGRQLSPWDGNDTPAGSNAISYERWTGVTGSLVSSIPVTTTPTNTGTFSLFEGTVNYGSDYGQRIRGYLTAPFTGAYTFFVASAKQGELWLSPDRDPVNKVRLVQTNANAGSRVWTTNADQKSAPVNLVRGEIYYIEGLHKESTGTDNFAVGWAKPGQSTATASEVVPGAQLSPWDNGPQSGFGYVSWEKWNGISGTSVASIPVSTPPNETGIHKGLQAILHPWGDNFGHRIRGYVLAPLTGSYTFWIASNETSEFWMSTDENPTNKVRLANVPAAVGFQVWNTYAAQKSAAVNLVAYHYYYIEILHKEGTGDDHLSVGWAKPGQSTSAPSEVLNKFQLAPWGLHDYSDISDAAGNICFDMWFGYYPTIGQIPIADPPDITGAYEDLEGPTDWNGSSLYAQRIRGFLVPPTTGNYTFWVSADDKAELWLSTNDNPVNKVRIAYQTTSWADKEQWNKYPLEQKSAAISLTAGNRYYVEVLHNETAGLDHIEAGWAKPGQSTAAPSEIIPGTYLEPLDEGCGSSSVDVGWVCKNPYSNAPMPAVVEEECSEAGNTLSGQDCCDPCNTSCYNQCIRGYKTSSGALCDVCSGADPVLGDCDALWEVPEEPFNCEPEKPEDAEYSAYSNMALAVIEPEPVTAGAWRNVIIYVDASQGEEGNFYLTVEKRKQSGGPCERINDNPRITDVTDVSASGATYSSSIENLVNSRHVTAGSTSCGGYDCAEEWVKDGTCHSASGTANAFWPAWEGFVIHRAASEGSQTYCITAQPAAANGLNPVVTVMTKVGATKACFENLSYNTCAHANYLSTQSQVQLTASPGTLYLIEVSRYAGLARPCLNASGDGCNYSLTVKANTCP